MKKHVLSLILVALLAGCATVKSTVPEGYTGSVATIRDSVTPYGTSKADFFCVTHVDGTRIEDSRTKTLQVNSGRGMYMAPVVLQRNVLAQALTFKIVGRTEYAAPIMALTHTVFEVSGDVKFVPEKDATYVVKGILGDNYSAVWIERADTNAVVGDKIEIKGSAKLGVFEK